MWSALFGVSTVVLIGLLGRRLGGDRVGLLAALIAAVHPLFVGADVALMSESLYGAVVAGLLLAGYPAVDRPTWQRWSVLGAIGGVAALTRNEGITLAAIVVLACAIVARTTHATAPGWRSLLLWLSRWWSRPGPFATGSNSTRSPCRRTPHNHRGSELCEHVFR